MRGPGKKLQYMIAGTICAVLLCTIPVYAAEREQENGEEDGIQKYVDMWTDSLDLKQIDTGMEELFPELDIDSGNMLQMILEGRVMEALR